MNILELKNVNKSYDGRKIIDNLTISIPENSLVAITGKSGSGKSTILNIDSGSIKINGNSIPNINSSKATMLRRNTINYLFQSYALISDITVLDNLMVAMEFLDLSKKEKNDKIDKVLKDLDIFILKNKKVNTLSGGEQQRVALARCILKPGNLILADEPTGSLDPKMAEIVFELIKYLRDKYNKTVIIVTHDISLANKADFIVDLSEMKK